MGIRSMDYKNTSFEPEFPGEIYQAFTGTEKGNKTGSGSLKHDEESYRSSKTEMQSCLLKQP
ncbi:hypothetical protein ACKW6Q_06965 [Chryseobacterium kwangjuense]|uniref:Uncharacterized protein n=1 Tax=Chryseobacterium kwangjuense TaxID=267125 RepID=A0ABW9K2M0_9FLAO